MDVKILHQDLGTDFSAPDLTDEDTDWSDETLDVGEIQVLTALHDYAADPPGPADSFLIVDDDVQPDTWVIKDIPDLQGGFSYEEMPIVQVFNWAVPDYTAEFRVTPNLAMGIERGYALSGVVREIGLKRGTFGDSKIQLKTNPAMRGPVQRVMVPVLRLHCPKHDGCKASEEYAVQQATQVQAKVSLTAVGAGGSNTTTFQWSSQWETADGQCLQYVVPAEIFTEYGTLIYKGKVFESPGLVSLTSLRFVEDEPSRQELIPRTEDGCQLPSGAIQYDRHLTKREAVSAGVLGHSFKAVKAARGTLTLGVAQPGWPSLNFEYERTVTNSFTRSVKLAPGATYLAYTAEPPADSNLPEHAEILWTTL
ncbi:hypothetical protein [Mycolicibacterium sphagni]|nr:hypothetical protein [Mycolicibacterium sphagni]